MQDIYECEELFHSKATAKANQIHGFIERCIQKAVDEGLIDLSGQGRDKYGK